MGGAEVNDAKRSTWTGAAATLAAAILIGAGGALGAAPASAQQAGDGWWSWALPAVLDGAPLRTARGDIILRRGDRAAQERDAEPGARGKGKADNTGSGAGEAPGRARRRGDGPPFCRDGRGHPVHGLEWCRDKGWDDDGRLWQRASWPDVILGRDDRDSEVVSRGGLADILGDILLGRVDERTRYLGADGALLGRWVDGADGATILQIKAGEVPVAELTDGDGDGRADGVILLEAL
jgi:hypothetical protein